MRLAPEKDGAYLKGKDHADSADVNSRDGFLRRF